jgi:aryl-alcohol dehydrogenase-like predicted oxidoreductase
MSEAIGVTIPGARKLTHLESNLAAGDLPPLSDEVMAAVADLYRTDVAASMDNRW